MKITTFLFICTTIAFTLSSCFPDPDFPDEPRIEFESVIFKEVGSNTDADSLIMTINFEDGNGDIGLDDSFAGEEFRNGDFFSNGQTGNVVTIALLGQPGFESLPPYEFPFECENWIVGRRTTDLCALGGINTTNCDAFISSSGLTLDGNIVQDTVYFVPNKNRNNFDLTFLSENSAGEFVEYDFENDPRVPDPCAINFSFRITPISDDPSERFPIEGSIRFAFVLNRIPNIFGDQNLKLRIQIRDRALNESNVVESPPFRIDDIRVN